MIRKGHSRAKRVGLSPRFEETRGKRAKIT